MWNQNQNSYELFKHLLEKLDNKIVMVIYVANGYQFSLCKDIYCLLFYNAECISFSLVMVIYIYIFSFLEWFSKFYFKK